MEINEIKEVTVFTNGDSENLSTWSNIPFFFTKTLIEKGIKVNRVNIDINRYFNFIYSTMIYKILSLFFKDHVYAYDRTIWHRWLINRKIRKAIKQYSNSDLSIFMTFSFYNQYSEKPSLLFCDWTYELFIKERLKREPYAFEKEYISYQKKTIESAKLVVSLFPKCAEYMKKAYRNPNIYYLGGNVVNSYYWTEVSSKDAIARKAKSNSLLFIGDNKYKNGALLLIDSYKELLKANPDLELNIVGMTKEEFNNLPKGVKCHGYLRKENPQEKKTYYELLSDAKIFINPTPLWAGYSSTIEAMYFHNPVIVSPYADFVEEFGENITFGLYCNEFKKEVLAECIQEILDAENYVTLCSNAHKAVASYTWDGYMDRLLIKVNEVMVA
ncbi:glycosyltransferase family 4 protein [Spirosoma jeollabukense]